ncbi:hypothetical protein [Endozoicomonas sp. OPT23]|uniref:hypothetical protein n=1 Tax=Endozoicomonas sp. OPT23 TaxID=2072845 RepID=UPI00129AE407|nr:hypothetical protein [Endozoicomonas sp. OPT23]
MELVGVLEENGMKVAAYVKSDAGLPDEQAGNEIAVEVSYNSRPLFGLYRDIESGATRLLYHPDLSLPDGEGLNALKNKDFIILVEHLKGLDTSQLTDKPYEGLQELALGHEVMVDTPAHLHAKKLIIVDERIGASDQLTAGSVLVRPDLDKAAEILYKLTVGLDLASSKSILPVQLAIVESTVSDNAVIEPLTRNGSPLEVVRVDEAGDILFTESLVNHESIVWIQVLHAVIPITGLKLDRQSVNEALQRTLDQYSGSFRRSLVNNWRIVGSLTQWLESSADAVIKVKGIGERLESDSIVSGSLRHHQTLTRVKEGHVKRTKKKFMDQPEGEVPGSDSSAQVTDTVPEGIVNERRTVFEPAVAGAEEDSEIVTADDRSVREMLISAMNELVQKDPVSRDAAMSMSLYLALDSLEKAVKDTNDYLMGKMIAPALESYELDGASGALDSMSTWMTEVVPVHQLILELKGLSEETSLTEVQERTMHDHAEQISGKLQTKSRDIYLYLGLDNEGPVTTEAGQLLRTMKQVGRGDLDVAHRALKSLWEGRLNQHFEFNQQVFELNELSKNYHRILAAGSVVDQLGAPDESIRDLMIKLRRAIDKTSEYISTEAIEPTDFDGLYDDIALGAEFGAFRVQLAMSLLYNEESQFYAPGSQASIAAEIFQPVKVEVKESASDSVSVTSSDTVNSGSSVTGSNSGSVNSREIRTYGLIGSVGTSHDKTLQLDERGDDVQLVAKYSGKSISDGLPSERSQFVKTVAAFSSSESDTSFEEAIDPGTEPLSKDDRVVRASTGDLGDVIKTTLDRKARRKARESAAAAEKTPEHQKADEVDSDSEEKDIPGWMFSDESTEQKISPPVPTSEPVKQAVTLTERLPENTAIAVVRPERSAESQFPTKIRTVLLPVPETVVIPGSLAPSSEIMPWSNQNYVTKPVQEMVAIQLETEAAIFLDSYLREAGNSGLEIDRQQPVQTIYLPQSLVRAITERLMSVFQEHQPSQIKDAQTLKLLSRHLVSESARKQIPWASQEILDKLSHLLTQLQSEPSVLAIGSAESSETLAAAPDHLTQEDAAGVDPEEESLSITSAPESGFYSLPSEAESNPADSNGKPLSQPVKSIDFQGQEVPAPFSSELQASPNTVSVWGAESDTPSSSPQNFLQEGEHTFSLNEESRVDSLLPDSGPDSGFSSLGAKGESSLGSLESSLGSLESQSDEIFSASPESAPLEQKPEVVNVVSGSSTTDIPKAPPTVLAGPYHAPVIDMSRSMVEPESANPSTSLALPESLEVQGMPMPVQGFAAVTMDNESAVRLNVLLKEFGLSPIQISPDQQEQTLFLNEDWIEVLRQAEAALKTDTDAQTTGPLSLVPYQPESGGEKMVLTEGMVKLLLGLMQQSSSPLLAIEAGEISTAPDLALEPSVFRALGGVAGEALLDQLRMMWRPHLSIGGSLSSKGSAWRSRAGSYITQASDDNPHSELSARKPRSKLSLDLIKPIQSTSDVAGHKDELVSPPALTRSLSQAESEGSPQGSSPQPLTELVASTGGFPPSESDEPPAIETGNSAVSAADSESLDLQAVTPVTPVLQGVENAASAHPVMQVDQESEESGLLLGPPLETGSPPVETFEGAGGQRLGNTLGVTQAPSTDLPESASHSVSPSTGSLGTGSSIASSPEMEEKPTGISTCCGESLTGEQFTADFAKLDSESQTVGITFQSQRVQTFTDPEGEGNSKSTQARVNTHNQQNQAGKRGRNSEVQAVVKMKHKGDQTNPKTSSFAAQTDESYLRSVKNERLLPDQGHRELPVQEAIDNQPFADQCNAEGFFPEMVGAVGDVALNVCSLFKNYAYLYLLRDIVYSGGMKTTLFATETLRTVLKQFPDGWISSESALDKNIDSIQDQLLGPGVQWYAAKASPMLFSFISWPYINFYKSLMVQQRYPEMAIKLMSLAVFHFWHDFANGGHYTKQLPTAFRGFDAVVDIKWQLQNLMAQREKDFEQGVIGKVEFEREREGDEQLLLALDSWEEVDENNEPVARPDEFESDIDRIRAMGSKNGTTVFRWENAVKQLTQERLRYASGARISYLDSLESKALWDYGYRKFMYRHNERVNDISDLATHYTQKAANTAYSIVNFAYFSNMVRPISETLMKHEPWYLPMGRLMDGRLFTGSKFGKKASNPMWAVSLLTVTGGYAVGALALNAASYGLNYAANGVYNWLPPLAPVAAPDMLYDTKHHSTINANPVNDSYPADSIYRERVIVDPHYTKSLTERAAFLHEMERNPRLQELMKEGATTGEIFSEAKGKVNGLLHRESEQGSIPVRPGI